MMKLINPENCKKLFFPVCLITFLSFQTLAQVVLKSPTFRDFKATKMYNYLKDHVEAMPRPDADEVTT